MLVIFDPRYVVRERNGRFTNARLLFEQGLDALGTPFAMHSVDLERCAIHSVIPRSSEQELEGRHEPGVRRRLIEEVDGGEEQ